MLYNTADILKTNLDVNLIMRHFNSKQCRFLIPNSHKRYWKRIFSVQNACVELFPQTQDNFLWAYKNLWQVWIQGLRYITSFFTSYFDSLITRVDISKNRLDGLGSNSEKQLKSLKVVEALSKSSKTEVTDVDGRTQRIIDNIPFCLTSSECNAKE